MCDGRCKDEDISTGECAMVPFDHNKCTLELWDGDIGEYDIPLELRIAYE